MYNCAFDSFNRNKSNQSLIGNRPSFCKDHKANYFTSIGDKTINIPLELRKQTDLEKQSAKFKTTNIIKSDRAHYNASFALSTIIAFALSISVFLLIG